jgi:hypothetical protein
MYPPVVTKDPTAVEKEVQSAYLTIFPKGDPQFVPGAFRRVIECFAGNYRDYQAIDVPYHDLEHTLQGTLCMARLLRGRHQANARPQVTRRLFELGILAILLHDTGYLKKRDDRQGTGAKYTITHVQRSAQFAAELLGESGFYPSEIKAVQNMILCTGLEATLNRIPFQNEMERVVGFALGTADLLGQLAPEDYVDKLPLLYTEFAEAAAFTGDKTHMVSMYSSAEDLMRKTPEFWETFVQRKLKREFGGLYEFLNDPYPDGPNEYRDRIESNMKRLRERLATARA